MEVAFVVEQCFSRVPGGTGRYAAEVSAALRRTAAEEDSVTLWAARRRAAGLTGVDGSPVHRLPLGPRALTLAWERSGRPRPPGTVVHAPTLLAPLSRTAPTVVTIHDAVPWTHPETLTPRGVRWHRAQAERAARWARAVVVPTHAVADELPRHLRLARRPVVIGEGVATSLRQAQPDPATVTSAGLKPGAYLVTTATLEPRKGLDVVVRALAEPSLGGLQLAVIGQSGWGGVDVLRTAADHGVDPGRIKVLGRVSDGDMKSLLVSALAAVVPSRAEGFGLPVLEAMHVGIPVIVSSAPALVEVAGGAALVVPVGDPAALAEAVSGLVCSVDLRTRLAGLGLARASEYSWDDAGRRLWELYAEVS